MTASATSTKIPIGAPRALPLVCVSSSGRSPLADEPAVERVRGHVIGLRLLRWRAWAPGERRQPGVLGRQRPKLGQARRDRPYARQARGLCGGPQLEQRDADEQLAPDREMSGVVDLVSVDEGAVARVEVLDPRAVLDRSDANVTARDELVLEQRAPAAGSRPSSSGRSSGMRRPASGPSTISSTYSGIASAPPRPCASSSAG